MQGKYSPSNLMPGFKGVKEVIVRGIGKKDGDHVDASIQITPDLGVFSGDVTWKLYKSSTALLVHLIFIRKVNFMMMQLVIFQLMRS